MSGWIKSPFHNCQDTGADDMNRRGLILGLASLVAAPAIIRTPGLLMPVKAMPRFTLYGDGLADDTEAMNAYLQGEPVWYKFTFKTVNPTGPYYFPQGTFRMTGPMILSWRTQEPG